MLLGFGATSVSARGGDYVNIYGVEVWVYDYPEDDGCASRFL